MYKKITLAKYPNLITQWHMSKNHLEPFSLSCGSHKKVWWQCEQGHEWNASIKDRAIRGDSCPYCSAHRVSATNCLAATHPEIAKHTKNGDLTPFDITFGSHKRAWWQCSIAEDHEWETTINKKFWWKCPKEHEWKSTINNRTNVAINGGSNCPYCRESKGEKVISFYLKKHNIVHKRQWKFNSCRNKLPLPFDFVIWVGDIIYAIEYQGKQHYLPLCFSKNTNGYNNLAEITKRDNIKRCWCEKNNVNFLTIPYWEDNIEEILHNFLLGEHK